MRPHDTIPVQTWRNFKGIRTFLGRWLGGRARLWAFQAAHCQLAIAIRCGKRGTTRHLPGARVNLRSCAVGGLLLRGAYRGQ
jgi:hypothetical protein